MLGILYPRRQSLLLQSLSCLFTQNVPSERFIQAIHVEKTIKHSNITTLKHCDVTPTNTGNAVMATFETLLANSLELARQAAQDNIVQSGELSRSHRERLLKAGWLTPVIRGWYILGHPGEQGKTTHWFASYWDFISQYLNKRFGADYCLAAESSLDFHLDQNAVPSQLVVMTGKGGSNQLELLHQTSLLMYETAALPSDRETRLGIQTLPIAPALCRSSPALFSHEPVKAEIALRMVEPTDLVRILLMGGHTSIAGRLIGAYRFLGDTDAARFIESSMVSAGHQVRSEHPFAANQPVFGKTAVRITSPYAARIRAQWQDMREDIIIRFPGPPGLTGDLISSVKEIEKLYQHDAYHSLSIEGYEVTPGLIERLRTGEWNPDVNQSDAEQRNAMAAKGYAAAFMCVCESVQKVFDGGHAGETIKRDQQDWYQALFSPGVQAGIIKPAELAGYRNAQVYIRNSAHVPLPKEALLDGLDAYFECLINEPAPIVSAILGHFFFVFIHPYMDGNGRVARFLMNVMLVSGGYPWTIIRSDRARREQYMQALEQASVHSNIIPFAEFIGEEMAVEWEN